MQQKCMTAITLKPLQLCLSMENNLALKLYSQCTSSSINLGLCSGTLKYYLCNIKGKPTVTKQEKGCTAVEQLRDLAQCPVNLMSQLQSAHDHANSRQQCSYCKEYTSSDNDKELIFFFKQGKKKKHSVLRNEFSLEAES